MNFRANEKENEGFNRALNYLVGRNLPAEVRESSKTRLIEIIDSYGPVIENYPTWHPLVSSHNTMSYSINLPGKNCGYAGLNHTIYLRDGIISCPYDSADKVIKSVEKMATTKHIAAVIKAEKLDFPLYHPDATPVLITCEWDWKRPMNADGTIPTSLAIPLMLERELPAWHFSEVGETWESMRPYLLGHPHGSRSSLFVDQETGQTIKKVWNTLISSGMYGPIKVD